MNINFKHNLMRIFIFFIATIVSLTTFAQTPYNPVSTPNTYRQADNPNYWKNKAPAGYWQQDVHYTIKANIDETKDIIDANQQLVQFFQHKVFLQQRLN